MNYGKFSEIRNEDLDDNGTDQKPIIYDSDFLGIGIKRKKIKQNMLDNNEISRIFNELNKHIFDDDHKIDQFTLLKSGNTLIIQNKRGLRSVSDYTTIKRGEVANILNQTDMVVKVQYTQGKGKTKEQDILILGNEIKLKLAEYCTALKKYTNDASIQRLENIIALCNYEENLHIPTDLLIGFLKMTQYQFGYGKIKH